jgi:hypothetical protein
MLGHLLCGALFGVLICVGCVLLGVSLWGVVGSLVVGANVGLGASATTSSPGR